MTGKKSYISVLFYYAVIILITAGLLWFFESDRTSYERFKLNKLLNNNYEVGHAYLYGKGVKQDKVKGLTIIFESANDGDESSTELYANMLWNKYSKEGVTDESSKELFTWIKKASLISSSNIYPNHLGFLYEYGVGVGKNHKSAIQEYKKAMKRCNDKAKYALASLLRNGDRSIRDYKESFKYKLELAHKGHAWSQYQTALNYNAGVGVIQDYIEAYAWLLIYKTNTDDAFGFAKTLEEELRLKIEKNNIVKAQERAKALTRKTILGAFKKISFLCSSRSNLID
jgi:TPR repeat protein